MLFTAAALSSLSLIATFSSTVAAHGSDNAHDTPRHIHQRQADQTGPVIITSGSKSLGDGKVHSRIEINDMFENRPDQWSLLVLAMQKFQSVATSSVVGYFGISSIHGVPRETWDGVEQCDACSSADGYCTHDSVLFPAWHRAYTALFEQELLKVAKGVVDSFPAGSAKKRMQTALQTLRLPFWDWGAKPEGDNTCLPKFLSSKQITVTTPTGEKQIDNPLYSYEFKDPELNYYSPFTNYPSTMRYPTSNDASASSVDQDAVTGFDGVRQTLQDQVYNLLANCDNYLYFSNDSPGSTYEKCSSSLEAIHNSVHTTGGGPGSNGVSGGHLTYLPLSSFDPLFMFHHCNVDRIFAMWQTIYPDSYGAEQAAPHSTWTIAEGSTQGIDSDLTPFRDSANSYWTTRKVQNWEKAFGYTYPEFASTDGSRQAIIDAVNGLYGPNADRTAASISQKVEKSSIKSKRALQAQADVSVSADVSWTSEEDSSNEQASTYNKLNATSTGTSTGPLSTGSPKIYPNTTVGHNTTFTTNNGSTYEYLCHFQSPRYSLNGSYVIYAFDGTPESNDTSKWINEDNCIGLVGVLAGGAMAKPEIISYAGVPMTRHLQERCDQGKLKSMQEEHVVPYLAKNLEWKIVRQGQVIHPDNVPKFQATVYSGASAPASSNSLGSWDSYTPQVQVTHNKAGGAQTAPSSNNPPYPASNGTTTGTIAPSGTSSNPPTYTGGADKSSFQLAGLLAAAALVAFL